MPKQQSKKIYINFVFNDVFIIQIMNVFPGRKLYAQIK